MLIDTKLINMSYHWRMSRNILNMHVLSFHPLWHVTINLPSTAYNSSWVAAYLLEGTCLAMIIIQTEDHIVDLQTIMDHHIVICCLVTPVVKKKTIRTNVWSFFTCHNLEKLIQIWRRKWRERKIKCLVLVCVVEGDFWLVLYLVALQ